MLRQHNGGRSQAVNLSQPDANRTHRGENGHTRTGGRPQVVVLGRRGGAQSHSKGILERNQQPHFTKTLNRNPQYARTGGRPQVVVLGRRCGHNPLSIPASTGNVDAATVTSQGTQICD